MVYLFLLDDLETTIKLSIVLLMFWSPEPHGHLQRMISLELYCLFAKHLTVWHFCV